MIVRQANFVETREDMPTAKPVGSPICGEIWDSVFIQVTMETYLSEPFQKWLRETVITHLEIGGSLRIAVDNPTPVDN